MTVDTEKPEAWLLSIEDDGDTSRYVFTNPEWAAWMTSYDPAVDAERHSVVLTMENIPASIAAAIRAMDPDEREMIGLDEEDALGCLTSGTYDGDKIHFITAVCEEVPSVNDLARFNIVGEFSTIAY